MSRVATARDVPAVADCLASAFFDDPLWGRWTFPDRGVRARDIYPFMKFWAETAVRDPWVRMTDGGEAVTIWHPPGEPELTPEQEERLWFLMEEWFGDRAEEMRLLFHQFDENHPQDQPHFYLAWWATHRDHAGRGLGSMLIKENLSEIDATGLPCFLESTNPVNLPRYEALGFERQGEFGPPGGPVITTMWRNPPRRPPPGATVNLLS
jgi:GNAT superfamily N-acetyltransferase